MEKLMKLKEKEFEKLNALVLKLSEKISESEKSMIPDELLQNETEEINLDITFLNPSSETQCDLCDFIAKNIKGLKIHKRSKHTKALKFKCDECDFETNNKKLYNDHNASKCSIKMMCEFCGETFKSQDEENEHVKNLHPKVKNLTCDLCEFETNIKKFYNDHKASKCLKIFLCDFSCGQTFETEEEVNEHMKTIHW